MNLIRHYPARLLLALLLSLPVSGWLSAAETRDGVVWIDVRSAREYRQGHIEGAINIPHGDIGHKIFEAVSDTFVEVHLYDGSQGTFAGLALELLKPLPAVQRILGRQGHAHASSRA